MKASSFYLELVRCKIIVDSKKSVRRLGKRVRGWSRKLVDSTEFEEERIALSLLMPTVSWSSALRKRIRIRYVEN